MTNKERYIELCNKEKSIPIFSRYFWLDAVCGTENWNVILINNNKNEIIASMPYYASKEYGLVRLKMPRLTQKLGPWLKPREFKSENDKLSYEKEIFTKLIEGIPKAHEFKQSFDYTINNWLPFYWKGFVQTTRYTYAIKNIKDLDLIYSGFDRSKKKNINKAKKIVSIDYNLGPKEFYENHKYTLSLQNQTIEYSFELFRRICNSVVDRGNGKIICARDDQGNIHGALFIIWDNYSAYDLISTIDPTYRNSGSATLLVLEAIKYSSKYVDVFDFEGSMIEGVERSFRKFGSNQTPYFQVSKVFSKRLKLAYFLKDLIEK